MSSPPASKRARAASPVDKVQDPLPPQRLLPSPRAAISAADIAKLDLRSAHALLLTLSQSYPGNVPIIADFIDSQPPPPPPPPRPVDYSDLLESATRTIDRLDSRLSRDEKWEAVESVSGVVSRAAQGIVKRCGASKNENAREDAILALVELTEVLEECNEDVLEELMEIFDEMVETPMAQVMAMMRDRGDDLFVALEAIKRLDSESSRFQSYFEGLVEEYEDQHVGSESGDGSVEDL
ncbi:uncharacterized protein MKK02DRAFT_43412 [Dioszegia hungarica]|uniref:Uncharacterized protein n=1 Tax=Dioszegia hungarica TaxID=4972 RepID=A0AA38HBV9_9TREE|nr:uncharacterized protein MKK02DRAFT_43412 [Dioszegia hungarica]KAI9637488.1 hypothetical protein MKK02DRAFT_43412 [Dioszegia hungarica]